MENSQDQPLPPGVHSWPNNLSKSGQTPESNYSGCYQFSPNVYTQYQFSPTAFPHTPGQQGTLSHSGFAPGQAITSEASPTLKLIQQPHEIMSTNNDIDVAAQDAVLREQVRISCVLHFHFVVFHLILLIILDLSPLIGNRYPKYHKESKVWN